MADRPKQSSSWIVNWGNIWEHQHAHYASKVADAIPLLEAPTTLDWTQLDWHELDGPL